MSLFGNKKVSKGVEEVSTNLNPGVSSRPQVVMMNDGVNICATACACCWDSKLPNTYEERSVYIGKRAATGHTSIIEHSNLVLFMKCDISEILAMAEFLSVAFYLHTCMKQASDGGAYLIIGGSWRGYSDLFRHIQREEMEGNCVYRRVIQMILQYVPVTALRDLVKLGILKEEEFDTNPAAKQIADEFSMATNHRLNDKINIVNADNFFGLADEIRNLCPEPWVFTYGDLLPFCTVTIEFNKMSRIITQQLTRHRNAITQESQRYVDYSGAPFNSPALFKPDKYDPKRLYRFIFGGKEYKMNLQDIGDAVNSIYPQLKDKINYGTQALVSEDARAYLTNNTQCGKIFITFTYATLIKFLELREDMHAQPEINWYAKEIGKWFRSEFIPKAETDLKSTDRGMENIDVYDAIVPDMLKGDDNFFGLALTRIPVENVKVVAEDENEVSETLTEEEYAKFVSNSIDYVEKHPEEVEKTVPEEMVEEDKGKPSWDSEGMR